MFWGVSNVSLLICMFLILLQTWIINSILLYVFSYYFDQSSLNSDSENG